MNHQVSSNVSVGPGLPRVTLPSMSRGQSAGHRAVRPNPSLNTPTSYGKRCKPGLWPGGIITVRAYSACLRSRG
jgi:hypothetical protein